MTDQERVTRHEKHFTNIYSKLDKFREDYVKAPTFVITLVTVVLMAAGTSGWLFKAAIEDRDRIKRDLFDLAKNQVRLEQNQKHHEKNLDLKGSLIEIAKSCQKGCKEIVGELPNGH